MTLGTVTVTVTAAVAVQSAVIIVLLGGWDKLQTSLVLFKAVFAGF